MSKKEKLLPPGLIVFIGEAGHAIYQSFRHRSSGLIPAPLEYLQQPYFSNIAFVRPGEMDASYSYHFANVDTAMKSGSLVEMLEYMMDVYVSEAQSLNNTLERSSEEEPVLNVLPSISIVGHIQDPELRLAVTNVRANATSWKINCLCCSYPRKLDRHDTDVNAPVPVSTPDSPDLTTWVKDTEIEFCYLFEDDGEDHAVVHYSVALALFTLLIMNDKNTGKATQPKIGTVSTCLVSVPRQIILHACCFQVSAFILASWLAENEKVREDTKVYQEIQKRVDHDIDALKKLLVEKLEELPGANKQHTIAWWWNIFRKKKGPSTKHYTWTRFAPIENEQSVQSDAYTELVKATKELFQHTTFDNTLPSQAWLEEIDLNHCLVRDTIWPQWKQHAEKYWQLHAQTTREFLDGAFQDLAKEDWRASKIITYADLLDEKLQQLQQDRMREEDVFSLEEDPTNSIYEDLYATLILHNQKIPTKSTLDVLIVLAIMSFFVFSFLLLNISLPLVAIRWQAWLIALLLPFVGIVLGNWCLLTSFYLPPLYAKSNILLCYRSIIAARCKQENQKKSALVLASLRSSINFMLRENIKEYKDTFEEGAQQIIAEPFKSVEAVRTVYVGNSLLFPQNEEFASYTFLKTMVGRETRYEAAAQKMFQEIKNSDPLLSSTSPSLIDNGLNSSDPFEQKEAFRKRLSNLVESLLKFNTIKDLYNVSAIDPQVSKIWNEIARRLNLKLWSKQGEMQDAQSLILCGTKAMLTKMRTGTMEPYKKKSHEIFTTALFSVDKQKEQEEPGLSSEPTISEWFLVAAFYYEEAFPGMEGKE